MEALNTLRLESGFWEDQEASSKVNKEISDLENSFKELSDLEKVIGDGEALLELLTSGEEDPDMAKELDHEITRLRQMLDQLAIRKLFNGRADGRNAILTLHPGAGGTEAQDWAEMLYRMYVRWAEKNGFALNLLDYQDGDEAGLKSVSFEVLGPHAYGYLKSENGVHRLIRISPFDTNKKRHTTFASVDVLPEAEEGEDIDIRDEDLKVDTYRASGAGGQHVNKKDSAVRITHVPTGIIVQCQSERSQITNRAAALKILRSKLLEKQRIEEENALKNLRSGQMEIAWGSQIRSYVFQPYQMVKDHRTGVESGNVEGVLDGDLDAFIRAYLLKGV